MALPLPKFKAGQNVLFAYSVMRHSTPRGSFRILKLLPQEGAEQRYLIKGSSEAYERVANESDLERTI